MRLSLAAALAVVIFLSLPARAQTPMPAVGVSAVARADITPRERFAGRAEAIDRVELIARVSGFLEERRFAQGERVAAGDLLFVIEPGPYEARLAQRRAELASAEAEVETARAQLERGEALLERNNIPAAEVDERRARLLVAQGKQLEAEAAVEIAELDLGYTRITAPIAGRIGRYAYSIGAFVGPESGPLATIVQQNPVYVTFPVSQRVLTEVRQEAAARGTPAELVVRAELPTGELYDQTGTLTFTDVEVAPGTDTVSIRATFPNPQGILTPGQFLNVVIELGEPVEALVIPSAAFLIEQGGTYVLVVGDDDVVEKRRIVVGDGGAGADAVVEDGLREGERIVVEGIQKVRPGQEVEPTPIAEAAPS